MKVVVPLAEIVPAQLTTSASGSAIHGAIQRKMVIGYYTRKFRELGKQ